MVGVAQLVESRIVIPVVVGSSPIVHPIFTDLQFWSSCSVIKRFTNSMKAIRLLQRFNDRPCAKVAELVDVLDFDSSSKPENP